MVEENDLLRSKLFPNDNEYTTTEKINLLIDNIALINNLVNQLNSNKEENDGN